MDATSRTETNSFYLEYLTDCHAPSRTAQDPFIGDIRRYPDALQESPLFFKTQIVNQALEFLLLLLEDESPVSQKEAAPQLPPSEDAETSQCLPVSSSWPKDTKSNLVEERLIKGELKVVDEKFTEPDLTPHKEAIDAEVQRPPDELRPVPEETKAIKYRSDSLSVPLKNNISEIRALLLSLVSQSSAEETMTTGETFELVSQLVSHVTTAKEIIETSLPELKIKHADVKQRVLEILENRGHSLVDETSDREASSDGKALSLRSFKSFPSANPLAKAPTPLSNEKVFERHLTERIEVIPKLHTALSSIPEAISPRPPASPTVSLMLNPAFLNLLSRHAHLYRYKSALRAALKRSRAEKENKLSDAPFWLTTLFGAPQEYSRKF